MPQAERHRLAVFYLILIVAHDVLGTQHWRVSDDNKRIEAVPDSPYALALPGNLVDFLRQAENIRAYGHRYAELQTIMKAISLYEKLDDPKFEENFRATDESCKIANGLKLEAKTFETSYTAELCPEFHESYKGYTAFLKEYFGSPPENEQRPPRCNYWFEAVRIKGGNFDSTKINKDTISPDPKYAEILESYFPGFLKFDNEKMEQYGVALASLLSHHDTRVSSSPYLHMAAAAYWRVQGKLLDAAECYESGSSQLERNLDESHPSKYAKAAIDIATSTLLTRLDAPDNAQQILHSLRDDKSLPDCFRAMSIAATGDASVKSRPGNDKKPASPNEPAIAGLTLAERRSIFSPVLRDYAISVGMFDDLYNQNPKNEDMLAAKDLTYAKSCVLSCHIKLTNALEAQKQNLDQLTHDKNFYNEIFNKRLELELRIRGLVIDTEIRQIQRLFYESIKYGYNKYRTCVSAVINRRPDRVHYSYKSLIVSCKVSDEKEYEKSMIEFRKSTLQGRPAFNETSWRLAEVFGRSKAYEKKLELLRNTHFGTPTGPIKYLNEFDSSNERPWRRVDWPNTVDCQAIVSTSDPFRIDSFPQLFISPENLGFSVSDFLTKYIGLEAEESLPLPWFEPRCDHVDEQTLSKFQDLDGIRKLLDKNLDKRMPKLAETNLKRTLVRLAGNELEEIEIGGRIWTLIKYNIGPRYFVYNLAALYWRVIGNPYQAATCLIQALADNNASKPSNSFLAIVQLSQVLLRATRSVPDAHSVLVNQINNLVYKEPTFQYAVGRMKILLHDVDKAIQSLKDALDVDPQNDVIFEDLLKIACSGKSTRPAISSQFPTVCCSPLVQNAVCIKSNKDELEKCYVVDIPSLIDRPPRLVYHRCNGLYTGYSYKTSDFANIISPLLPVFNTVARTDDVSSWVDDVDGVQSVDSAELPLDYGGSSQFFAPRPAEWWMNARNEMRYEIQVNEPEIDNWEEALVSSLAKVPSKPLSFLWIKAKAQMLSFDIQVPSHLPTPSTHLIRTGISTFPPHRVNTASCSGVAKLDTLFENAPSTWVSVTAKGEDIEKYVDLRGPMPGIASLQPICPYSDKYDNSPILGMDHIPAFSLSDQFLFYKPEKALTDALKALGNERDTIEHIAARLHTALLANGVTSKEKSDGKSVNWLLCVLSSLYWRVTGDAENAINCLRCALHTAPTHVRDVALVSLANMCHQAGLVNSALVVAGAALSTSPKLVAIHFTLANIYATLGDYQRALNFYYSTLSLQSSFQPAKERIRAILCHSGQEYDF